MPDSLPFFLEYRVGCVILFALPRRPVQTVGSNGATDAAIVHPRIPVGAEAWRLPGGEWQAMETLPGEWMPWLNR